MTDPLRGQYSESRIFSTAPNFTALQDEPLQPSTSFARRACNYQNMCRDTFLVSHLGRVQSKRVETNRQSRIGQSVHEANCRSSSHPAAFQPPFALFTSQGRFSCRVRHPVVPVPSQPGSGNRRQRASLIAASRLIM